MGQDKDADETKDWRLGLNQAKYLQGVTVHWTPYWQPSETWDHDHCEFCFATFTEQGAYGGLPAGYAVLGHPNVRDDYYWICQSCYEDFKERFGWTLADDT